MILCPALFPSTSSTWPGLLCPTSQIPTVSLTLLKRSSAARKWWSQLLMVSIPSHVCSCHIVRHDGLDRLVCTRQKKRHNRNNLCKYVSCMDEDNLFLDVLRNLHVDSDCTNGTSRPWLFYLNSFSTNNRSFDCHTNSPCYLILQLKSLCKIYFCLSRYQLNILGKVLSFPNSTELQNRASHLNISELVGSKVSKETKL